MTETLVEFVQVVKRFDDFVAVRNLNLSIARGEFVALMGPSGCGKTTTLRMLAGLEKPTSGQILLDGRVMNDVSASERDTPMVWQSLALFPFLNARENVEFGLKMRGVNAVERKKRAINWLERLDMGKFIERPVNQLSGGQRQRVALARSLVIEPSILLLDEPLSALDAHLVIRMQGVLSKLQKELGITFVYVTHSQSEAFAMADRVVIMGNGDVAQIGTSREIYRAPANRFVAQFVGRNNILSGVVSSLDGSLARFDTACGQFSVRVPESKSLEPGHQIQIAIAADRLRLQVRANSVHRPEEADESMVSAAANPSAGENQAPEEALNRVDCTLISEEFVGAVVTLFFETADGTELMVQVQERELDMIDVSQDAPLTLTWSADAAHVLND